MITLPRRVLVGAALVGAAAVAVPTTMAAGGGTPANKAVAAGSRLQVIGANQTQTLLSATFKTSKTTDLLITASLECTILTALTTNNANPTAAARSGVRAWLTLDGKVVPITDTSAPPQDPADNGNGSSALDGVNFCDREYARTVTDAEDPADGIDETSDYIRTKSAHSFSWVRLNAGSGMHTLQLVGQFNDSQTSTGDAQAFVGNRTLVIEPTKLANDAVIAENGAS
jgi:hypothetical protein